MREEGRQTGSAGNHGRGRGRGRALYRPMGELPRDSPVGEKVLRPGRGRRGRRGRKDAATTPIAMASHSRKTETQRESRIRSQMINMALTRALPMSLPLLPTNLIVRSASSLLHTRFPSFRIARSAVARGARSAFSCWFPFPDGGRRVASLSMYIPFPASLQASIRPSTHPSWRRHTCHSHAYACHLVRRRLGLLVSPGTALRRGRLDLELAAILHKSV